MRKPVSKMAIDVMEMMRLGWHMFPVEGKVPVTSNGVKDATTDTTRVASWYRKHPDRGAAVATGKPSGLWVLDLDSVEHDLLSEEIPVTVTTITHQGYHLYFKMPGIDIRNSASKLADGVDVRGTGGYVIVPPSPHPDGGKYRWLRAPWEQEVAETPDCILERLRNRDARNHGRPAPPVDRMIPEGRRNESLTSLAGTLRHRGLSKEEIYLCLEVVNERRCRPVLGSEEVGSIAESVGRYQVDDHFVPQLKPKRDIKVGKVSV